MSRRARSLHNSRFGVAVSPPDHAFAGMRPHARSWLVERAMRELDDELVHLDRTSAAWVSRGRPSAIEHDLETAEATFEPDQLKLGGYRVMHAFLRPVMEHMGAIASASGGRVIEI